MAVKDAFLAGILATVPEADRGKAEARLEALEAGELKQSDYSRLANEANAAKQKFDDLYTKNTEWYTQRQTDLAELDDLRAKVAAGIVGDPAVKPVVVVPPDVITKKVFEETLAATERGAVGFIAEANGLTMKHFQQFGEILNINDLLTDPRVQQIGLQGVYADKFKDQIKAKADAAETARQDAIRKDERTKVLAEVAGQHHPYPVVGNESSSLDAIEAAARSGDSKVVVKSLDDMAAEYARLNATRAGAST